MYKPLVSFEDGSFLRYGRGKFDNWCIYLTRVTDEFNVRDYAPHDCHYFKRLQYYASIYGNELIYKDFVTIYNLTSKEPSSDVFDEIKEMAKKYKESRLNISIIFSILYMGMIAEENKEHSRLGKRIKRLGIYQILMENVNYEEAANFSRNKRWRYLDKICTDRGF